MKTTPKLLEGTICIGNPQGGQQEEEIFTIEVTDHASGTRVIEIEISPHNFAMATKGRGYLPVKFRIRPERVGYVAQHREEIVPIPRDVRFCQRAEQEKVGTGILAAHPLAADGWHGDVSDLFNSHRTTPEGQRVSFRRHVHPESGEPYRTVPATGAAEEGR